MVVDQPGGQPGRRASRPQDSTPLTGTYEASSFDWVRDQVELYERTGGQDGNTVDGRPIVILRTRGARSGSLRKSPVMRFERDGVYVAIASVGGFPTNPAWYHNLIAEPRCQVQDGAQTREMIAREALGEQRERLWEQAVRAWPHYAELQAKTDRQFPIMVIEPAPEPR